ncbi:MAG: ATP-binding cassette domain-containing protein [Acidobacteria bacterium]|nr:ATP-binding cassette domain-containing protein [Acidobacteriota bacterium]MBV9187197.1 ATP-binding cassette domain-containing protein [Acidobacteriota bacterium]
MLQLRELQKTFFAGTPNEVRALRGVSLQIEEGSFVTVIGTNGSGKSTLLNAVAGSFFADGGAITIAGRDVTRWPEHRRAAMIGRVFQNPFSGTAPTMTVSENLALAARRGLARGLGSLLPVRLQNELRDRVATLNMQLETRMHNPIGTLSGGQRQALTLLMATWRRPELLLLDEHTAALDPKSADQIVRLTERIVSQHRLTTLMVTHSMQQAATLGDRIVMMNQGLILADYAGTLRRHIRAEDLVRRFDEIRRDEQLDASAAEMLRENYV